MGFAMYIGLCCVGVLITNCFLGAEAALCPSGWLQKQENCYGYFDQKLSWNRAETECQSYNSRCHLASLLSYQESLLVAEYIKDKQISPGPVWIGLHDVSGNRRWRWTDQSPFNYQLWRKGEPNNALQSEHCVELTYETNFRTWNDLFCNRLNGYICKY